MLSQFRRALGVTIVRDMANHKLSRLHYVRATAEDAKNTAEANHSDNRGWNYGYGRSVGSGRRSGWYSKHTPGGYADYEHKSVTGTSLARFKSVPSLLNTEYSHD